MDLQARELRKGGLRLRVPDQSIEILAALVATPGEVVTRDEIRERLWPNGTIVEFDNSVNAAVRRLREALSDSAGTPRFIETLPRRGYRFLMPVERTAPAPVEGTEPPRRPAPGGATGRRLALVLTTLALVLSIVALLVWHNTGRTGEELKPVALVSMGGDADSPSFSPDGNRVAFTWRAPKELSHKAGEDQCGLYVKLIGGGPPQRLTRDETDQCPAWSPDHRYIAFLRGTGEGGAVMLVPSIGGPERRLAKMYPSAPHYFSNLSWTPDAKWLVLSSRESPNEPFGLWLLSAETGERRRLLMPPAGATEPTDWPGDFAGTLSGDGRALPFARNSGSWQFQLYELRLTRELKPEGEPRRLTDRTYSYFRGAAWASGNELVYSVGANSRLWRMRIDGSPRLLNWAGQIAEWPSIAASKRRLVYRRASGNSNLWRLNLQTGDCRMLVSSNDWQTVPQYSPDGRRVAFIAYRSGEGETWTCDADGANCQQITFFGGGTPRWSPDSLWLAVDSRAEGKSRIYVIAADGGTPRPVTSDDANSQRASWSHDGKWIYFESDRNGRWRIWRAPVAGGPAVPVTNKTGGTAFESADGKYVYFTNGSAPLFRVSIAGGDEVQVAPKVFSSESFSVTAKGVYFLPDERTLQWLDLKSGKVSTLAKLDKNSADGGMSVSQDDAYMVYSQDDHLYSDIMIVANFR